jgi:hypothetical protein
MCRVPYAYVYSFEFSTVRMRALMGVKLLSLKAILNS